MGFAPRSSTGTTHRMRRTKIIATVGPASDSDAMLDALVAGGADIFRLNFSHGTHDTHAATFARIRAAGSRAGRAVAVLQDLGGPKIRTGALVDHRPIRVAPGDHLRIATGDFPGEPGRLSTTFEALARTVRPGDRLLLADGLVELRVDASDGREIQTTVVEGGEIGEHKGINAPGVPLPTSAITPKDVDDLRFGLSLGVDMVAVSFVQSAADLRRARHLLIDANAADVPLMAKLERPQALDVLGEILAACDAVMVARGDLGLEMPLERVPRAQKEITRAARRRGIPVVVATQVLESMIAEPRPTRAEVNDAASAVDDGVDAIMLAGETAVGAYAARAVQTLDAIIRDAESTTDHDARPQPRAPDSELEHELARIRRAVRVSVEREAVERYADDHAEALCAAAVTLADRGHAQAIVAVTRGGNTARRLSALRPMAPIFATTDRDETARRLAIHWGVIPVCTVIGEAVESAGMLIGRDLVALGFVPAGATVVLVSINADLSRTDANYLKIQRL
jgi:pyruvate kinase